MADAWTCEWCEQEFPVPVLARDCEAKHVKESDPALREQPGSWTTYKEST